MNKLITEVSDGKTHYNNVLIWTRGQIQECPSGVTSGNTELAENLRPYDVRFAKYLISGRSGNGFHCFSNLTEQIVVRLGGKPNDLAVTGVWRFVQPETGSRPKLEALLADLSQKFPSMGLSGLISEDKGFYSAASTDEDGDVLTADEIREDYYLSEPVAPTPLKTTEGCGFLWLNTCPRVPPQSEIDDYNRARQAYETDAAQYSARKAKGNSYYACVSADASSPGDPPVSDTDESKCGMFFYIAATPYPGGFAEGIYTGLYDHRVARAQRAQLDEYVRGLRGNDTSSRNTPL